MAPGGILATNLRAFAVIGLIKPQGMARFQVLCRCSQVTVGSKRVLGRVGRETKQERRGEGEVGRETNWSERRGSGRGCRSGLDEGIC